MGHGKRVSCALAAALLAYVASAGMSRAAILTAAGSAEGFTLSTFTDQYPFNSGGVGPVGIAFLPGNHVMVSSYASGQVVVFNDVDNQHFSAGVATVNLYGANNIAGLTTLGGNVYAAMQGAGALYALNSDGSFNHLVTAGLSFATGIAANPFHGTVYVSRPGVAATSEIDPLTGAILHTFGGGADGLTLSADGSTLYGEIAGHIIGYNTSTFAQVFDSGFISGADGVALGTGSLGGKLFVNTNFGQVVEVDSTTMAQTLIVTGGTRGDLVNVDPNGSLLFTQTESVWRLTPPKSGGFEGGGTATPLPGSVWMGLVAMGGMAALGFRRRPGGCRE